MSISPSRLGRVTGRPRSSSVAMAEKVVPRSMPINDMGTLVCGTGIVPDCN